MKSDPDSHQRAPSARLKLSIIVCRGTALVTYVGTVPSNVIVHQISN
jgi:hypothetical protein